MDAKLVTIGGGESEVGGIVEKCEVDDLKTEPIARVKKDRSQN